MTDKFSAGLWIVPDIAKLLWPKTVALIGASSDTHGLRGRILRVMKGHAFPGTIYPVSRSQAEVQGLKAFRSVADLPEPVDLAVLIIPAKHVPEELERCGRAGVKAAVILSSGFAEEPGGAGADLQDDIRAIATRYDMAVNGPNSEGFANTALALCPTFSPVMEAGARPLLPPEGRTRGQIAVVAQSGGIGFAFFDRGRPRDLAFRYVVTTGNEAGLETFDYVDHMLDEGKTDAFLLWLEDVKSPADVQARRREGAARRQAADRRQDRAVGAGPPRSRVAHRRACGLLCGLSGDVRALRRDRGERPRRDGRGRIRVPRLPWTACRPEDAWQSCTSSGGGGGWLADACAAAASKCRNWTPRRARRSTSTCRRTARRKIPSTSPLRRSSRSDMRNSGALLVGSPAIDGVLMVVRRAAPRFLRASGRSLRRWRARREADPVLELHAAGATTASRS